MQLTITGNPDGSVSVNGPLGDKATCYALLELAKDAIREHHATAASPIVRPTLVPNIPRAGGA